MADGSIRKSIRKKERNGHTTYEVVVDLGNDPMSGARRQRSRSFKTMREARLSQRVTGQH